MEKDKTLKKGEIVKNESIELVNMLKDEGSSFAQSGAHQHYTGSSGGIGK